MCHACPQACTVQTQFSASPEHGAGLAQVGRAGRDRQEAQCHLFLDDADFRRLHSLSNSDSVAASSVQAFLEEAFQAAEDAAPSAEDSESREPLGMAVLAAQELSQRMDLKVEVMETLLSYLEVRMPIELPSLPQLTAEHRLGMTTGAPAGKCRQGNCATDPTK